jgi:hypothetical protein
MQTYGTETTPRRGQIASLQDPPNGYMTAAAIPAGIFVCEDSTAQVCKEPTTATEVLQALGVVLWKASELPPTDTSADDYPAATVVPVLARGDVWVVCEEAMAVTDDVYVRRVAGVGEQLGAVRTDADTDDATLLPNVRVVTASDGAGVVKLRINLPAAAS